MKDISFIHGSLILLSVASGQWGFLISMKGAFTVFWCYDFVWAGYMPTMLLYEGVRSKKVPFEGVLKALFDFP